MNNPNFIVEVLKLFAKHDCRELLWWQSDTNDVVGFYVNGNYLLELDATFNQQITPDNIGVLRTAFEDAKEATVFGEYAAPWLFCCRVAKMRPQGAEYPENPALWPLFDACGPERAVDALNPMEHPAKRKASND